LQRSALPPVIAVALIALLSAPGAGADWRSAPVVPKIHGATERQLIRTIRKGRRLGNRADVFAKVGDSISWNSAFLQGLGCGRWTRGHYARLEPTVERFGSRRLSGESSACPTTDSFSRDSAATEPFTASAWAIMPGSSRDPACGAQESPLVCEIRLVRPAFAIILFGTNDVTIGMAIQGDPLSEYVASMRQIVTTARALGVAPILTTIPPRLDGPTAEALVDELNAGLHRLAVGLRVPLINLWRALIPLPSHGISADGLHPSIYPGPGHPDCISDCRPTSFTPAGLRYGFNMRNLITLITLQRASRVARPRH
jgi:hypothetical protein